MSNKTSDENVGSIEEDIKIIKNSWLYNDEENVKFVNAIEHLLSDYTRQKQINEEHQKENGLLREKVKELDTKNDELLKDLYSANCIIADLTDSIPKQKIKDKVEEIRHKKEEYEEKGEGLQINDFFHRKFIEATHKIRALEELLQESEDK